MKRKEKSSNHHPTTKIPYYMTSLLHDIILFPSTWSLDLYYNAHVSF